MLLSNKRPISPESTNGHLSSDQRSLKRLKLHSIIQELRNEEAKLVLLKKLRASQQISVRQSTSTNGHHPTATRVLPPTKSSSPATPLSIPSNSSSRSSLSSAVPAATRKVPIPGNAPSLPTKVSTAPTMPNNKTSSTSNANSYSLNERKAQAKNALRLQLERDLLNIPAPKPLLQDILFVPNPNSLEFQPYIGLEDVVQCLYELQNDRHRLPQRFTDRAQIDEPYVCEHCGSDYTIRWWKHLNTNNGQTNILCDRCKKQVTRRTLKSDHSALLKNVFVSAMEQEKEIEKTFQTLIKQQQQQQQQQKSSPSAPRAKVPAAPPAYLPPAPNHHHHHQVHSKPKTKSSSLPQAQNFATKLSQQPPSFPGNASRKSNAAPPPPPSTNNVRPSSTMKTPLPAHHHHHHHQQQQQQFRSATSFTPQQQAKQLQMAKMPKSAPRQTPAARSTFLPTSTPLIPPPVAAVLHPSLTTGSTHHNARPTAAKRRTLPSVPMK